jgi:uncharacterized membrane protein
LGCAATAASVTFNAMVAMLWNVWVYNVEFEIVGLGG